MSRAGGIIALLAGLLAAPGPAGAQFATDIRTDGFLPGQDGMTRPIDGSAGIFEIGEDMGFRPDGGANLFHSFDVFDLGVGDTALFTALFPTSNVISRVTGCSPSRIYGTLASDIEGADLYLLNPKGIVFGPHSQLDLKGSFYATSAHQLFLSDGGVFSAVHPETDALSVAPPEAFGFLGDTRDPAAEPALRVEAGEPELTVPVGATFSLVGEGVEVAGRTLRAPAGVLDVLSVGSEGRVPVVGRDEQDLAGIALGPVVVRAAEGSAAGPRAVRLDVSGVGAGHLLVNGSRVRISGSTQDAFVRSELLAANKGAGPGGSIDVVAREHLEVTDAGIRSAAEGSGSAPAIHLRAPLIELAREGSVVTESGECGGDACSGRVGDIHIEAGELRMALEIPGDPSPSAILSTVGGSGEGGESVEGGNITLVVRPLADAPSVVVRPDEHGVDEEVPITGTLTLRESTMIDSIARGSGRGGAIRIDAARLEVADLARISSLVEASGEETGGAIEITADQVFVGEGVSIDDRSKIETQTMGSGRGGDIHIAAGQVEVGSFGRIQSLSENRETDVAGPAGDVEISAASLRVNPMGEISSVTRTTSAAGEIRILGGSVDVLGPLTPNPQVPTGIFSFSQVANGAGGRIRLGLPEAPLESLRVANRAAVSAASFAQGDAGEVEIHAGRVVVEGGAVIDSTGALVGSGGDVDITASEALAVTGTDSEGRSSRIGALSFGPGSAGSVTLRTGHLVVEQGGLVSTSTLGLGDVPLELSLAATAKTRRIPLIGRLDLVGQPIQIELDGTDPVACDGTCPLSIKEMATARITFEISAFAEGEQVDLPPELRFFDFAVYDLLSERLRDVVDAVASGEGDGGSIEVEAGRVDLRSGGQIDASSFSDGSAGAITLTAGALEISGEGSGIFARPGPGGAGRGITLEVGSTIVRDGGEIAVDGGEDALDLDRFTAATEDRFLEAAQSGFPDQKVPTDKLPAPLPDFINNNGVTVSLGVEVPPLENFDSLLERRTLDEASAGSLSLSGHSLSLLDGGRVSASAVDQDGGAIKIEMSDSVLLDGANIVADVVGGTGGNISIATPGLIVLRDGSAITASAEEGRGGNLVLSANGIFVDQPLGSPPYAREPEPGDNFLAATGGEPGLAGTVLINGPEAEVVANVTPLETDFLDAASQLQPVCAARAGGVAAGSFTVARRRGLPGAPEDLLLAFDDAGLAAGSAIAPVAAPRPGASPAGGAAQAAMASLARGAGEFRGGHFDEAAESLSRASQLYAELGDSEARIDALRALAQAQQAEGRFAESLETLAEAQLAAEKLGSKATLAALNGSLGNAYLALGSWEAAEQQLRRGVELAREAQDPALAAGLLNNLANLYAARGDSERALEGYAQSARLAAEASRPVERAKALSNAARAASEAGDPKRASELLDEATGVAKTLEPSHEKASVWIHLAATQRRLEGPGSLLAAHTALTQAILLARELDDARTLSYALGNLGGLYAGENRDDEALLLTRRALRAAEEADAPELLYHWYWQEGRLLWAQGKSSEALHSYRRAVVILQEIRPESRAHYGSAQVRFRRAVAPVYVDFVDALVQGSGLVTDPVDAQRLLVEARATMEQLKAAELRDYFRDECVAEIEAHRVDLDRVSRESRAALVYPIALPDRLELLVSLPSGIERVTVPVGAEELRRTVQSYGQGLQNRITTSYRGSAEQLYDWLVRPYAAQLAEEKVETLVFVPDAALRAVPMAALHDGEQFLAERYAVAVTPGLSLVDPRPLDAASARLLLAGLSEPVQGFAALPNTTREIEAIRALYGGEVLLDEAFETGRFEAEVEAEVPSVVHVASHAVFTGDPSTSFVLTHDGRLSMDELSELVAPTQFRRRPLELLTLSACETAAGDERAALGLAGVAIRAGARSALGSLWAVQDEATYELVVAFYAALKEPGASKAEALRRAQAKLIADPRFAHPFYWSPFLLISNWL